MRVNPKPSTLHDLTLLRALGAQGARLSGLILRSGFGARGSGFGFRVQGLGFRLCGLGSRV